MDKVLCKIGWHSWTWKLSVENGIAETVRLNGDIPDRATCKKCGIKYK